MYAKILIFTIFFQVSLWAQKENASSSIQTTNPIDRTQGFLSKQILTSTNWIDSFFGNKKSLDEKNGSRIRLFYIFSKQEAQNLQQTPAYKVDIRLPNLEKRMQISFESDNRAEQQTPTPETKLSTETDRPIDGQRGSISYFFKELATVKFKLSAGAKFALPPTLFTNLRTSKIIDLPYNWKLRGISNTFWEQDQGFGESISFDANKQINENFNFRWVNEATWLDSDDTINASHGPSLYQVISKRRILSYNYRLNYTNRPNYYLTEQIFNLVYRQNIHNNWLFYEVIPSLNFARSRNFKSYSGITLKFECLVGSF